MDLWHYVYIFCQCLYAMYRVYALILFNMLFCMQSLHHILKIAMQCSGCCSRPEEHTFGVATDVVLGLNSACDYTNALCQLHWYRKSYLCMLDIIVLEL